MAFWIHIGLFGVLWLLGSTALGILLGSAIELNNAVDEYEGNKDDP